MKLLILLVFVFVCSVCVSAQNFSVKRNVCFGKTPEGRELTMITVNLEDGRSFKPACICIHGGGWIAGTAEDFIEQAKFMAGLGFKVFDVDYRLTGEAKWPAQIEDCKTAVRNIRANCKYYDINPNKILAIGHSAGGHLASLLGVLKPGVFEGDAPCWGSVSSRVQAVINLCGPENLEWYIHHGFNGVFGDFVAPEDVQNISEILAKASPTTHVSRAACPHLIIHGGIDQLVPAHLGEEFHAKMLENKASSKLVILPEEDHGLDKNVQDSSDEIAAFSKQFIEGTGPFAPVTLRKK